MNKDRTYRNNKSARPFSSEHALHVTMRTKLSGAFAVRRVRSWLYQYVPRLAFKQGVHLYHFSINGNHFHVVFRAPSQSALSIFLRVLAGVSARKVLGAERGRPGRVAVWHKRPYSRILSWGREFQNVMAYVQRNAMEVVGTLLYELRNQPFSGVSVNAVKDTLCRERHRRKAWIALQPALF